MSSTTDIPTSVLSFGATQLDIAHRQLLIDGQPAKLGARAFDVLLALVERRERAVTKNELVELVWPGLVVEENNLQVHISALRKLIGPQAIATIPGRGYQFTAAIDVVGHDRSAAATVPTSAAIKVGASAAPLSNLPTELPALYGRDADLLELRALIGAHTLVTVLGAGGIGKSRLAQAAAHSLRGRWPDGVWMVELAGLSDPALLPNTVAQAIDLKTPDQGRAQDVLLASLAQQNLLVVLDNCEHLLDGVAALVQDLMRAAPNITLLATSQEPLHVPAEQQYRLAPLAVPSETTERDAREFGAVALFEARVRAANPRFVLNDENLALAINICRQLDGLPLAIELAAARVATLGLRPVHDRLDARFKLLTGGSRATLRRHQTLRAALEWSHDLLNEAEQTVFRRLGAFAGGFSIELAQAVAGDAQLDEWAVLDHLSALVDKSLVLAEPSDAPRYRLLESARAFALEQLAAGETAEVLKRHALAMLHFIRRVDDANLDGELRTDQYAARVLPELDNLRAAYAWAISEAGDVQVAAALAAHAGSLIDYADECIDWLLPLRDRVESGAGVDPAVSARFWRAIAAGNMTGQVSLSTQADAAERARNLYQTLDRPRRVFSSLLRLSRIRSEQRNDDAAKAAIEGARALIRPNWPTEFHFLLLRNDARSACYAGELTKALELYRDGVRLSAPTGDWRLEVIARSELVYILWQIGSVEEAAQEACILAEELRTRPAAYAEMAVHFVNLVGILSETGRIDEATAAAREALPIMRRARVYMYYFYEWVYLFWRRGQIDIATQLLGASDAEQGGSSAPRQSAEQRLIAEARAALQSVLTPDAFARRLAAGAALGEGELFALVSEGLMRDVLPQRLTAAQ